MKEDLTHKNSRLNPRRHPRGKSSYDNPSSEKIWVRVAPIALLSQPEMKLLQDMPRLLGAGNYANLGHEQGGSAILLASGLREQDLEGLVYSVDIKFKGRANKNVASFELGRRISKCKGSTIGWADKDHLGTEEFNFVFIDADHCYEAVVTDFTNWSPLVRVGGMICFHDTNQAFSHEAIETVLTDNADWAERKDLHIDTIRTFQRG